MRKAHLGKHPSRATRIKMGLARSGSRNPAWKGGKIKTNGYIAIYQPSHPFVWCGRHKYVFEHRLVMEKYLGRYLEPWEVVHHKNGIKDDNRIENLQLLPTNLQNITLDKLRIEVERLREENKKLREIIIYYIKPPR